MGRQGGVDRVGSWCVIRVESINYSYRVGIEGKDGGMSNRIVWLIVGMGCMDGCV